MKTIRAVIVDDEPLARQLLLDLLAATETDVEVVGEAGDGEEALRMVARQRPDLLFLDVQMPGMGGFEVLERLAHEAMPYVIFVTAYDRYALRAFEVHAVDYLLKPVARKRFREAVERARASLRGRALAELAPRIKALAQAQAELQAVVEEIETPRASYRRELLLKQGRRLLSIRVEEIVWFEAANQRTRIHSGGSTHIAPMTLTQLEDELDPSQFCRIHRSAIVNTRYVHEVRADRNGSCAVILVNGQCLRLSRGRRALLNRLLGERR